MELSNNDTCNQNMKFIKNRKSLSPMKSLIPDFESELIDLSGIDFHDDETWLCSTPQKSSIKSLHSWLHNDMEFLSEDIVGLNSSYQSDNQKSFDGRTFTRPKKRFTRPSVEKYNEEQYSTKTESGTSEPLNFDLSQPSNSYYFENMVANVTENDYFQNMSPPSLVNSMCSSTFANLMESSLIKNDPVLREIRDTDFTQTVLLQDSEPPMFQSITESCSSLNSDTPEGFLKKVSRSDTFKVNNSTNLERSRFLKDTEKDEVQNNSYEDLNETQSTIRQMTPQKYPDYSKTFRRSDKNFKNIEKSDNNVILNINSTFHISDNNQGEPRDNKTINLNYKKKEESVEVTDLNRLSYYLVENHMRLDSGYNEPNDLTKVVKRSSISTGSADSLDRMSSISNGSRESNKIPNMSDVDAIIEMQEKSLQQAMSTPKLAVMQDHLWQNDFISPIVKGNEAFSDSDLSSNDDFRSVRSTISKTSLDNYCPEPVKISNRATPKIMTQSKQSYGNLKSMQSRIPGSQTNLYNAKNGTETKESNLKTMGYKLKGSYTSLRPISANLPIAPPPIKTEHNATRTYSKGTIRKAESNPRIVEASERINAANETFAKPSIKPSCLPRPTGIPRPASRIPAPRSSSARPLSRYAGSRSDLHNNLH